MGDITSPNRSTRRALC